MKICVIYHVSFERLGFIEDWITCKGHDLREFFLHDREILPRLEDFDMLIIMGGPMGVNDEDSYPWLLYEKELIQQAIQKDKAILGICLGAQLIASASGNLVYSGKTKEIGWFPVQFNQDPFITERFPGIPLQVITFHWHGDTFDLPAGAVPLAYSENTSNQAFLLKNNILGIQFHPEMKPENISLMINYGSNELIAGPFVQSARELADGLVHMPGNRAMLEVFLDYLESMVSQQKRT